MWITGHCFSKMYHRFVTRMAHTTKINPGSLAKTGRDKTCSKIIGSNQVSVRSDPNTFILPK